MGELDGIPWAFGGHASSMASAVPKPFQTDPRPLMYIERSYLTKNTPVRLKPTAKSGQRKYRLDELVRRITKKNRHDAVDWGRPVGKEIW